MVFCFDLLLIMNIKYWDESEDKQLLVELLKNTSISEISQIHERIEFDISLRIHLIIHRMYVSGLTPNEIRKKTNVSLSEILNVIHPVKPFFNKKTGWSIYDLW